MHTYNNPTIDWIWSRDEVLKRWTAIERAALVAKLGRPVEAVEVDPQAVATRELTTRHEVAAFLQMLDRQLGEDLEARRWLHYGLTSSDLVDTGVQMALAESDHWIRSHWHALRRTLDALPETELAGRTHGQIAAPKTLRDRFVDALPSVSTISWWPWIKIGGAVGSYRIRSRDDQAKVARMLHGESVPAASQIMPPYATLRFLFDWAQMVVAVEQIATDLRLMAMLGEVKMRQGEGAVGSSAMPGKINPIQAEQLCGLAKGWRADLAAVLDSRVSWLERDLHASCLDRELLPRLATRAAYLLTTARTLVQGIELDLDSGAVDLSRFEPAIDADRLVAIVVERWEVSYVAAYELAQQAIRASSTTAEAIAWLKAARSGPGHLGTDTTSGGEKGTEELTPAVSVTPARPDHHEV